jgi:hypothetical protein
VDTLDNCLPLRTLDISSDKAIAASAAVTVIKNKRIEGVTIIPFIIFTIIPNIINSKTIRNKKNLKDEMLKIINGSKYNLIMA